MMKQSMAAVVESMGMDIDDNLSSIKLKSLLAMGQGSEQPMFTKEMLDELLMELNQG